MHAYARIALVLGSCWVFGRLTSHDRCDLAMLRYGLSLPTCPVGTIRQTAELHAVGLRRGAPGTVILSAAARYTDAADILETAAVRRIDSITLTLVDHDHVATPLAVAKWREGGGQSAAAVTLPDVPDGDYQLHATYTTTLGTGELDAPLPLYTPARIHVITDRPLYEPGNLVRFRAVVLRARDLAPLDGRPGKWVLKDPQNDVLLEELAPAGDWGVVAGTFPLDKNAPTGTWHLAWISNDAVDEVPFTVEPFTLPRFRIEATNDKPFYRIGDAPVIRGAVLYSSGAPVAHANVDIAWEINGDWPPPLEWEQTLLPKTAVTGPNGRFELALPRVPPDLLGLVTITAQISAVDPAGDRVASSAQVLLSQDGIQVSAVTELGNGLVQGFNNRMFVRVTTPDGHVVANTKIHLKRAWQPNDNGIDAELDEDGVASLQLDPGAPVNIVIPAQPWRPAPRRTLVTRGDIEDLIGTNGAALADQVEIDKWLAALAPCAKWVDSTGEVKVGIRIDASGSVVAASGLPRPLDRCAVDVIKQRRLPAQVDRLYRITFTFANPDLPKLAATVDGAVDVPAGFAEQIQTLAMGAGDCLPIHETPGMLTSVLTWRVHAESKTIELGEWVPDPRGVPSLRDAMPCVTSRLAGARITLATPAPADSLGVVRFYLRPPEIEGHTRPQPTTMIGYELEVSAQLDGAPATTKLRVAPGDVPPLRLRVNPVLARSGETIVAEMIRGPNFTGKLPKELALDCLKKHSVAPLDEDHRARLVIDPSVEGWCSVTGAGVRALVYVRPHAELDVAMKPARPGYKPGDKAELLIQTQVGGTGGPAAVGLFGVDESLGQLVPLPGAGDMARVQPKVETAMPAFGVLDGQALALGRIRGSNAAAATVLRVSTIPSPPELDAVVEATATTHFDPNEELTDHFYTVLAEVHIQARRWETTAPASEKMRPAAMAELWRKALAACQARGERVDDAYGRTLRLSRLPPDLLALTDPRAVIVVGTRLPEDVENWVAWVAKEKP